MKWENVTVKQYLEIKKVAEEIGTDELDKSLSFLKILFNEDYSVKPIDEFMDKVNELRFLQTDIPQDDDTPKKVIINGREYRVATDANEITTAQFIDYMKYVKMEDFDDKLIGIVSAFLIPATAKNYGDGYDFDDVKNDILDMSFVEANSIAFFLRNQTRKSYKRSLIYLICQILQMKITWREKKQILKNLSTLYQTLEYYHSY